MQKNTITMDAQGIVHIPCADVWMNEMELVELFNVTALTLRAAIRAVYKSGVLNPCEVERRTKMPNGHYLGTYSLPMVVALAFRINTSNAVMVRKALLERLCLRKERQVLLVSMGSKPSCRC